MRCRIFNRCHRINGAQRPEGEYGRVTQESRRHTVVVQLYALKDTKVKDLISGLLSLKHKKTAKMNGKMITT